jgi:hypothetical protein
VVFLRSIGRSFFDSAELRALIRSAFAGTASRRYLAETLIFNRLTSSCVAKGVESSLSIISRIALVFKAQVPSMV